MGIYADWVLPRIIDWTMQSEEAARYRRALVPLARGVVLEVGVGSGLNFPFYGEGVERVIGLDPSPELLRRAALRSSHSRAPVHLIQGAAEAIPLRDGSVDCVILTWVLCSIPEVGLALREMKRVLRPNGQLLFVEHGLAPEPSVAQWQHRLDPFWRRISCHLDRPMDALIRDAGFNVTELNTGYLGKGPKFMTFLFTGRASP